MDGFLIKAAFRCEALTKGQRGAYLRVDAYKTKCGKDEDAQYCNGKSLVISLNNHSSTCYSKIRACYLIFSNVKKKQEYFGKIFSGRH